MTDLEILAKVKAMSNYTGDYHDEFLLGWIEEAKDILYDSGVDREAINSKCGGVIAQIVIDITDNGGLQAKTSERIAQKALAYPRGA